MSDTLLQQALETAIRADEQAKFANKRLDAVNGSIDAVKSDVRSQGVALMTKIDEARRESTSQFDAIMRRLSHNDGVHEGTTRTRKSFLDSKWRVITLCTTVGTGGVGIGLFTYIFRRHTG